MVNNERHGSPFTIRNLPFTILLLNIFVHVKLATMNLTPEQQQVVQHDHGPALVFAVAGAGKTTAMVHRIERLVREGIFAPQAILATSFGRKNQQDLQEALQEWSHTKDTRPCTLHALGRSIIVTAQEMGHLRHYNLRANGQQKGNGSVDQYVLNLTLSQAWRTNVSFKRELDGLDRQDFLSYVAACKGNLRYANLDDVRLPAKAQKLVGPAPKPSEVLAWYVDLYQLYEQVRQEAGLVTYPDMLLTGWELLVRYEEVRTAVQKRYTCAIVDEFQDVNLVQSELLDLITAPHRNYMVVGDDDQTIYEWRGASPRFILNFAQRYQAQTYLISHNFRCPAAPLVLANEVIKNNPERQAKALRLTRGFIGRTQVLAHRDLPTMATKIVEEISTAVDKQTHSLNDIAILFRLNAQTPYIEQELTQAGIPYVVSKPFYERSEIQTLITYARLAWLEKSHQEKKSLSATQIQQLLEAWPRIANRPARYISNETRQRVADIIRRHGHPLSQALTLAALAETRDGNIRRMEELASILLWLRQQMDSPADTALRLLEARLIYRQYLRENSGFPQTGEGKAASVSAFLDYARGQGNLLQFLIAVKKLGEQRIGRDAAHKEAVTLTTIHQAKGLEWPYVIIAQTNDGMMPFRPEPEGPVDNMAEERRLFYVALTRTRENLSLHRVLDLPPSPFLGESGWQQHITNLYKVARLLKKENREIGENGALSQEEAKQLREWLTAYDFEDYVTHWRV